MPEGKRRQAAAQHRGHPRAEVAWAPEAEEKAEEEEEPFTVEQALLRGFARVGRLGAQAPGARSAAEQALHVLLDECDAALKGAAAGGGGAAAAELWRRRRREW